MITDKQNECALQPSGWQAFCAAARAATAANDNLRAVTAETQKESRDAQRHN